MTSDHIAWDAKIRPVILSGGGGTRLWPLSTAEDPKQHLALTSAASMLQLTARRVAHERYAAPIVVGGIDHGDQIAAQLESAGVRPDALILEPIGRNTAPAIALAALGLAPEEILLIMPSDHVIADEEAFHQAVAAALPAANDGWIVTMGVPATRAETGYGYIQAGSVLASGVLRAERFLEKPSASKAKEFVNSGDFFWNAGIFVVRADRYLSALGEWAPEILTAVQNAWGKATRVGKRVIPGEEFAQSPPVSIDNAVLERDDRVAVVPVSMAWSDVGSWDALYEISDHDERENVLRGRVRAVDTTGCLARTDGPRITLLGVSDLIVVAVRDEVLILKRGQSQAVRHFGHEKDE